MTISFELENEILRLAVNEEWPVGSIASQLQIHRDVVLRVLSQAQNQPTTSLVKASIIDPYLPFLQETLKTYPEITASRLFIMVKKRGYSGISQGHFRRFIRDLRPLKLKEAFLKLATLPGEQGQVDWADFGRVEVPGGERKLMAFVFTLSWSRAVFLHFYLASRMVEFQSGFMEAFSFFEGVPKVIIHDNLKSGVLERVGKIIRFNDDFLALARHYRFDPRAAGVRKGNQKGKVERSIRYIRDNFFAGRQWKDLDDLNEQAKEWCLNEAQDRLWQPGERLLVRDAFVKEKPSLFELPETKFPFYDRQSVKIGKVPYARFDCNDYSVPAQYVAKNLMVTADTKMVKIIDEFQNSVAEHARSYGKAQIITDPEHVKEILAQKKQAQKHAGLKRLVSSVPQAEEFIADLSMRNQSIGGAVTSLLRLLDIHGKERLSRAVAEVIASGSVRLQSIHFVLKSIEEEENEKPMRATIVVPKHIANLTVEHHKLSRYDAIAEMTYDEK